MRNNIIVPKTPIRSTVQVNSHSGKFEFLMVKQLLYHMLLCLTLSVKQVTVYGLFN